MTANVIDLCTGYYFSMRLSPRTLILRLFVDKSRSALSPFGLPRAAVITAPWASLRPNTAQENFWPRPNPDRPQAIEHSHFRGELQLRGAGNYHQ
jgi:hypothetical protein